MASPLNGFKPQVNASSHADLSPRIRGENAISGYEGPYAGGKHLYLVRGESRLTIPNLHATEIGVPLLARLLKQAGVSYDDWHAAGG